MEVLHALAVAPAAVGTCCAAADRSRGGSHSSDLAASALMTVAMLDAALLHVIPVLWWALALGAAAVGSAIAARMRQGTRRDRVVDAAMRIHAGVGMVVMAGLMLVMAASHTETIAFTSGGHHHAGSLAPVGAVAACAYGVASVVLAARAARWERVEYLAMGASTLLMGFAAML
ncbi:hypothetical protein ACFQZV_12790 [Microbacterium koreense]|uniref:DUF5134 domain-containing protein n=1 Tax=Microbacterium koreense TaxID=323761 RepID=A0ABW2ZU28_9MICO